MTRVAVRRTSAGRVTIASAATTLLLHATSFAQVQHSPSKAVAISAPRPDYPYIARQLQITGAGEFILNVDDRTGRVDSITVAKHIDHGVLDAAAMAAFIKWRFKPHTVSKVRIPIRYTVGGPLMAPKIPPWEMPNGRIEGNPSHD